MESDWNHDLLDPDCRGRANHYIPISSSWRNQKGIRAGPEEQQSVPQTLDNLRVLLKGPAPPCGLPWGRVAMWAGCGEEMKPGELLTPMA